MGTRSRSKKKTGRWWEADGDSVAQEVWSTAENIRAASSTLRMRHIAYMRMYGQMDSGGGNWTATGGGQGFFLDPGATNGRQVKYNLAGMCVDSGCSLITANQPVPQYDTTLGDWDGMLKARQRTRVLDGQFSELEVHRLGRLVQKDGGITGTGFLHGYIDPFTGRPKLERVLPLEVLIDPIDGLRDNPRSMFRRHLVPREVLEGTYKGKARSAIDDASGPDGDDWNDFFLDQDSEADQVIVVEAWHLPSPGGQKDGRHVVCTSTGTLLDEEWTRDRFPFARYRWKSQPLHYWGIGICEEVAPAQREINFHIDRILAMQRLVSNSHVLVEGNSQIKADRLANVPGIVYRYTGRAPIWQTVSGTPPDLQGQVEVIEQRAMRQLGLNPMTVQAMRQPGIDSGKAIRLMDDVQSRRHVDNAREYEDFFRSTARLLCDLNDDIVSDDKDYSVTARHVRGRNSFLKNTRWADLELEEGDVRFKVSSVSALGSTPAGKMQTVLDFVDRGYIQDPRWALKLLDMPDMDSFNDLELADLEFVLWQMERITEGERVEADEHCDPVLAAETARRCYERAAINGAPDSVLESFDDFIAGCKELIDRSAPPPPVPAPV